MRHIKLHVYTTMDEGIHEVVLNKKTITRVENCTMSRTGISEEEMETFGIKPEMIGKYPTVIYENGKEITDLFVESVGYIYKLLEE